MKIIRWGGLVTFFSIIGLLAAVSLFAAPIIKSLMESSFTEMNGAKVDIEALNLSYAPLTMQIHNIQIADPERAMVNTAQIDEVKFELSFGHLLLGKVVIDEASVTGIQIDTARQTSGLIEQDKQQDGNADDSGSNDFIAMPELNLPSVKDILAAEPLLSEKLINELKDDFVATEKQWNEISDSLPNKEKYEAYQARFNKIQKDAKASGAEKLAAISDAQQLTKDLKAEAERIKQAKDQFDADLKRLNVEIKAVKDAPAQDIARIKNKYSFDNMNAENISRILFGDQVAGYVELAKQWYARIEPYLPEDDGKPEPVKAERSKGVDVVFAETDPVPDVYVRLVSLTARLPRGQFEGTVTAISSDQSINKQPTRFKLKGVQLTKKQSEEINGEFNYIDKKNGFVKMNYAVVKSKIENFIVSKSSKLPLTMSQAMMDFDLDAKLQHGSLSGQAKTEFNQVDFNTGDASSMIASSFAGVKDFNIDARFNGSIENLSINIDSNLDNRLGQQLKNQLNDKKQAFESELKASMEEKLKGPMGNIDAQKTKLDSIKNKLDESEKQLNQRLDSLKATIKSASDQKKNEAKDKVKNKLMDKLGF